jgi:hypothetical protein
VRWRKRYLAVVWLGTLGSAGFDLVVRLPAIEQVRMSGLFVRCARAPLPRTADAVLFPWGRRTCHWHVRAKRPGDAWQAPSPRGGRGHAVRSLFAIEPEGANREERLAGVSDRKAVGGRG